MNLNKKLINRFEINSDHFRIGVDNSSTKTLLNYYNIINYDDYYILKASGKQKIVTKEEFLDLKYSCYSFFKKDLYNINHIFEWCNFQSLCFLHKPVPPFSTNKIIIKQ